MQNTVLRRFLLSLTAALSLALSLALFSTGCSYSSGTKDGGSPPDPGPPVPGPPIPGPPVPGPPVPGPPQPVFPPQIPGPTPNSGFGTPVLETPRRGRGLDPSYYIKWSRVPPNGALKYHLQESCSERENDSINWSPWISSTYYPINGYKLGIRSHTFCYFRIRAVKHPPSDSDGYGPWSNIVTFNNLFFIEESPRSNVSDSYDGSYTIHWNNIPNAHYYDLEESTDGSTTWVRVLLAVRQKNMESFSGKETGKSYRYKVRACGFDDRCGPWESSDSDVVEVKIPKTVININGSSGSYTVFETNGGFELSWNAADGADRYELRESQSGSAFADLRTDVQNISYNINGKQGLLNTNTKSAAVPGQTVQMNTVGNGQNQL